MFDSKNHNNLQQIETFLFKDWIIKEVSIQMRNNEKFGLYIGRRNTRKVFDHFALFEGKINPANLTTDKIIPLNLKISGALKFPLKLTPLALLYPLNKLFLAAVHDLIQLCFPIEI